MKEKKIILVRDRFEFYDDRKIKFIDWLDVTTTSLPNYDIIDRFGNWCPVK